MEKFEEIYQKYYKQVYAYIFGKTLKKEVAEDLLQETFLRVWKKINILVNMDEADRSPWIFKVAKNLLIDYYRKNDKRKEKDKIICNSSAKKISDRYFREEKLKLLDTAIKNLPNNTQVILYMKVIGEMTSGEIGKVLDMSPGTVRYKLHQARRQLEVELDLSPRLRGRVNQ